GTLAIPNNLGVLSRRAVSVSPGGSHRSGNQPFWKALRPEQQVISDDEIRAGLRWAKKAGIRLSYIDSVEDFRTRLNDSTCSGCPKPGAIGVFFFRGGARKGPPRQKAVFWAGPPFF